MTKIGEVLSVVVACYLLLRAVVEAFVIDVRNPGAYELDRVSGAGRGGPGN